MEQPIFPEFKAVDPRAYLAERVKRGVAFVAVLRSVGQVTEPCLSPRANRTPTEAYIDDPEVGDHYKIES